MKAVPETNSTASTTQSEAVSLAGHRPLRALLVEDCVMMRSSISKTLQSLDIQVTEAIHGHDALEKLNQYPVDLVFTDLVMPQMDGFELCEEIRRRPDIRHLPIVVISTHRDAHYVIQALRSGADDYLSKPFSAPLAQRIIERSLSHV